MGHRSSVVLLIGVLSFACLALAPAAGCAERSKKPKPPDPAEPVTLMAARGKLLLFEPFSTPAWEGTMRPYAGDFQVIDGAVRVASQPGAGHPPQLNFFGQVTDLVVQVRVRLDGGKRMGAQISSPERKQNLCSVMLDGERISINRMSGWGGTTRQVELVGKTFKAEKDRWYTLLIEWCGNECLVRLDDRVLLHAEAAELGGTKGQVLFQSSGAYAWYDDVRIWNAITDPTWAKRKAEVVAAAKKP